ncbi:hypothetical protein QE152_g13221 [Popillia japonica]|uniref:Uncharacterized protein n=1 Tax=Popillia japonica TaxID=7064 RepID=A0AAW1LDV8_POPJA
MEVYSTETQRKKKKTKVCKLESVKEELEDFFLSNLLDSIKSIRLEKSKELDFWNLEMSKKIRSRCDTCDDGLQQRNTFRLIRPQFHPFTPLGDTRKRAVYSKGTLFDLLDPNSTRLHLLGILENAIIIQISAHTPSQDMDDEAERLFKTMSKACRLQRAHTVTGHG